MGHTTALVSSIALTAMLGTLPACLDAQVDDTVPSSGQLLPAGTLPGPLDEALAEQIADNDGIDGTVVEALSGFAGGNPAFFWDFGPAPDLAVPIYMVVDPGTSTRIDHPTIFDSIPGDPQYSPFWVMIFLPITETYNGEIIPSVSAIEEAQRLGLIGEPIVTNMVSNCPVVAPGITFDPGNGGDPIAPDIAFVRGQAVPYFDINAILGIDFMTLAEGSVRIPTGSAYRLRRAGGEPLAEPARGVDMTGDGDTLDTNDIIDSPMAFMHLLRRITLAVDPVGQLVDESGDDTISAIDSAADLFMENGLPNPENVVAIDAGEELLNLPFMIPVRGGL